MILCLQHRRQLGGNSCHVYTLLQLIKLSDLENDFINPHDATSSINAWVVRFVSSSYSRQTMQMCPHPELFSPIRQ